MTGRRLVRPYGSATLMALALAIGIAIALVDNSPGWDSTGITAGALFLGAGVAAFQGRHRPWLWALLVGLPTPVIEIAGGASTGSLLALVFAGLGAAIGWSAARAR